MSETVKEVLQEPAEGSVVGAVDYRGLETATFAVCHDDGYLRVEDGQFRGHSPRPGPGPVFAASGRLWIESAADILARVDATLLRPSASLAEVSAFAELAREAGCRNVCVFPHRLRAVVEFWPRPATVISFPHGADGAASKLAQIECALESGAGEIDLVADRSLIAGRRWAALEDELSAIRAGCPVPIKVILETGQMPLADIPDACRAVQLSGCDYAKTSTGMVPEGASVEAVESMREACPDLGIKASGGIRTREAAGAMIRAGADVIGASDPHGLVI